MIIPLEFFLSVFKVLDFNLKFFGFDIFYDPDYKPGLHFVIFLIAMSSSAPALIYTAWAYDLTAALKAFTMLGIIIQVFLFKYSVQKIEPYFACISIILGSRQIYRFQC